MRQAYIIGELMTPPEAVMVEGRRGALPLQGRARGGSAPCTVCEVETKAIREGEISGTTIRHTRWQVMAYGQAATVLDTMRVGETVGLSGIIRDEQVGAEGGFTLHVTEAHRAHGRQERVVIRGSVAPERDFGGGVEAPPDIPPDDYEFFYDG